MLGAVNKRQDEQGSPSRAVLDGFESFQLDPSPRLLRATRRVDHRGVADAWRNVGEALRRAACDVWSSAR